MWIEDNRRDSDFIRCDRCGRSTSAVFRVHVANIFIMEICGSCIGDVAAGARKLRSEAAVAWYAERYGEDA